MKFAVVKDALSKALASVQRAVSTRGPLPILAHVKLAVEGVGPGAKLILTGTDLEIEVEVEIQVAGFEDGAITLPAKTFGEIVGKLPAGSEVEIATGENNQAIITCKRSKFTIRGLAATEFPQLALIGEVSTLTLPADGLLRGIRSVLHATAGEEKGVISGVLVTLSSGELNLVATDGYRLAWRTDQVEAPEAGDVSVVVPRRTLDDLSRHLSAVPEGGTVEISLARSQVRFSLGDRRITSRLVDGHFPSFQGIVPKAFKVEAQVNRAGFLAAVERVSIMASDREANLIKLELQEGELRLSADNQEVGNSDEALSVEFPGEAMVMFFNALFLAEALKHLEGETVRVALNAPLAPVLIWPDGNPHHRALLMPVNRVG